MSWIVGICGKLPVLVAHIKKAYVHGYGPVMEMMEWKSRYSWLDNDV